MARAHPDEILTVTRDTEPDPNTLARTVRLDSGRTLVVRSARLAVVDGPEAGREKVSSAKRIRIGSEPACDFPVTKDPAVSRGHCEVRFTGRGWVLVDLGSTNGTRLNGEKVESIPLGADGELLIGHTRIRFEACEERTALEPSGTSELLGLVGNGPAMRQLFGAVTALAPLEHAVLLQGEPGTGKEAIAAALHALSGRTGAFVSVDLAALPPELFDTELHGELNGRSGTTEGSVTVDATAKWARNTLEMPAVGAPGAGALDRARGGTLFLDGFESLAASHQARLTRALERVKEVRLVGGASANPQAALGEGRLRADLHACFAALCLELPPLRSRKDDVPALAARALARAGAKRVFSTEALEALARHDWPGNVRELFNVVEALASGRAEGPIALEELPRHSSEGQPEEPPPVDEYLSFRLAESRTRERFERAYIERLWARCGGDLERAVRESGLHPKTLEALLDRHVSGR